MSKFIKSFTKVKTDKNGLFVDAPNYKESRDLIKRATENNIERQLLKLFYIKLIAGFIGAVVVISLLVYFIFYLITILIN